MKNFVLNLIGRSKVEEKSVSLTDPFAMDIFGAPASIAGPVVSPASAMKVPAVAAAVGLISETTGSLPAKLYRRTANGGKEAAREHWAYPLIHDAANDWTSASEFRTTLTADALLTGNGYAFANRVNGRVHEFIRLDPYGVTRKQDGITGEPVYAVKEKNNREKLFAYQDILHVPAFLGVSPIHHAREAIALAIILEQHAAQLFANGARPSGVLSFDKALGDKTYANIKASWQAAHSGGKSGGTAVLEEGGKFQPLTFSSVDAQFAQMRVEQINEIARAFRIPPTMLFELSRATWSNAEEMGRTFLQLTLRPWLRAWEAAYTRTLLTAGERADYLVEFVLDDLVSTDQATRAASYAQFRSMGAITANEVRAGLNLPALPGGDELSNPYTSSAHAPAAPAQEAA